jgi:hypothetical protein
MMGKLRDLAVAVGLAKSLEQLQAEHWAAMFRANSPSDNDRMKARDDLMALAAKSRDENNAALQTTLWKNAKPKPKDPSEDAKQRGAHPSRVEQVYWPERNHGPQNPKSLTPVY